MLQYFAMERLLYRLSLHPLADRFVLNGALLMTAWKTAESPPTADIDLSGRTSNDQRRIRQWLHELCKIAIEEDGIVFGASSLN